MRKLILLLIVSLLQWASYGQIQGISPQWLNGFWKAKWIAHPSAGASDFGVYHFRKNILIDRVPQRFVVHLSADNLYRFFVNGKSVATGPARSDPSNWNFESVDIAPFLKVGDNLLSATVWNFSEHRAYAQTSFQTAFIVQGDTESESITNTDDSWKVIRDSAYAPLEIDRRTLQNYFAVSSGEIVDARRYAWDFMQPETSDKHWPKAMELWYPAKARTFGTDGNWHLVPRTIPMMQEIPQQFSSERTGQLEKLTGGRSLAASFPIQIPAQTRVKLLFDQGMLTNAYPKLQVSGGRDGVIEFTYAEALVNAQREKGNRHQTDGKKIMGIRDRYISDGGVGRVYSPLHYRTFRYLELDVQTGNTPLTIDSFGSMFTAYPFEEKARFVSSDKGLEKIWETGWRTARLCAMDTYMDCPYYEQLQYVGDTRIQALISLYVSGDDRLMRKAIDDISHSFIPDGLTQSRYPSRDLQVIPTFSLWWVTMLHDYYMHRTDDAFLRGHLDGVERVIGWYTSKMDGAGMLGPLNWWQFVDWSWPWVDSVRVGGVPPGVSKGGSAIVSLQFAYTLRRAAVLMKAFGRPEKANAYQAMAADICRSTYRRCYDAEKKLMADSPEKNSFSQHANILAILADAVPENEQAALLNQLIADRTLTQATYYFRFYLFEALRKTGMGNRYLDMLQPWYDMLNIGLTTFAENPEPTRSDCHAWSASPVYEFLSLTAGVEPMEPGFKAIRISPNPGKLQYFDAAVPVPSGMVSVQWTVSGKAVRAIVTMPPGSRGQLNWRGESRTLKAGKNEFHFD